MLGRVIDDKYRIIHALARGGMGSVYEARHIATGRTVALKVLLREAPEAQRRFALEALAAGSIASQHVVQVLDAGVDRAARTPYLVMELLHGLDLRALLMQRQVLSWQDVLRIAAQACLGLDRAHAQGIIHRDIKPANLFLARDEEGRPILKLLDFGVAKLRQAAWTGSESHHLTASGALLGSPLYMSPEQALGCPDLDGRSDLWSLGVAMYQALCGETPHANAPLGALVLRICAEPAPPLAERIPEVPREVAEIVHKALALERAQRFQSAREMLLRIRELLAGSEALPGELLSECSAAHSAPLHASAAGERVPALESTLPAAHDAWGEPLARASAVAAGGDARDSVVRSRSLGRAAVAMLMLLSGAPPESASGTTLAAGRAFTAALERSASPAQGAAVAPPPATAPGPRTAHGPERSHPVALLPAARDERADDSALRAPAAPATRAAGRRLSNHAPVQLPQARPVPERLTIDREM